MTDLHIIVSRDGDGPFDYVAFTDRGEDIVTVGQGENETSEETALVIKGLIEGTL